MKILENNFKKAALSAVLSALLYAACIPCIKILGKYVPPAFTGAFLYLGAGLGLMLTTLFKGVSVNLALTKKEIPWAAAMVLLDTVAEADEALMERYPKLTAEDVFLCLLYLLGFKDRQIGILLERNKSTIIRKRQTMLQDKMGKKQTQTENLLKICLLSTQVQ